MTSRERVLASVAHREPDRVAKDMGATPSSGISAIAYNRLIRFAGINAPPAPIYDVVQQLAQPDERVLDRYNIDAIDAGRAFNDDLSNWKRFPLADESEGLTPGWFEWSQDEDGGLTVYKGALPIARMPRGATYLSGVYVPYPDEIPDNLSDLDEQMSRVLWSALTHAPWDRAAEDGFWDELRRRAIKLRDSTNRALVLVCGCNLFEWGTFLRRIDNFLCDILTDPEGVERLMDALMERHMATLERACAAVGDVCDIIRFGDDLGMDSNPFMRADAYRKLFKPRHAALNDYVHKHSRMKTFLHSCGSIYPLLPDIIEAGYDILNPVQISARNMEASALKREFGRDITFWGGGCDTRHVLNHATPAQVKDHVRRQIDTLAPGGGFVFSAVHNILPDVPPENIEAMFEAVNEY